VQLVCSALYFSNIISEIQRMPSSLGGGQQLATFLIKSYSYQRPERDNGGQSFGDSVMNLVCDGELAVLTRSV
jgi:hypothetical protein